MIQKRRYNIVFIIMIIFVLYLFGYYGLLMRRGIPSAPPPRSAKLMERGSILDRNGRILAIQARLADVGVWRPSIADIDELSAELAPVLGMSSAEIIDKINNTKSNFIYLKKQVDDAAARHILSLMGEKKLIGVKVDPLVGRIYPENNLASQIIGFVGDENNGLEGIEYAFNSILTGTENEGKVSQVVLTIDTNVQFILERIAAQILDETKAEAVMYLAMDPRSGDILGSASLPGFNPNDRRDSTDISWMNRPAIWAYEPGSVFKVFSISALMDTGAISASSRFTCNGIYERVTNRGEKIEIKCLGVHGNVSAREIIINSCNAGAAYASDRLGNGAFYDFLNDFGFGSRTSAGSPGESAGYLRQSAYWSDRTKPTLAIGQEVSVSAYQTIQAATAIANDGILVPPRVVSHIVLPDGRTEDWNAGNSRRILKAETARAMRSYMVDTASGMAWRAAVDDLSLAVKTGTAQIIDPVTKKYSDTDFIASCIALLPSESPSLILYLAVIKPKGEIFGSRIAAPAIREAANSLIDYLGIPRGRNQHETHSSMITIPTGRLPVIRDQVPDFSGIAKRTLLPLLLRDDINVDIRGDGWVRRQSPPPGTPVKSGMTIILELE